MNEITAEPSQRILVAEASQLRTLAEPHYVEPDVTVIDRREKVGVDGGSELGHQASAQDVTAGLLVQLLETQKAMLGTLNGIAAKLSSYSW
ncbi:hypothetical protein ACQUKI_20635 [Ralstonia pseudosolanacearum]